MGRLPKNGQRFRGQWEPGCDPIGDEGVLDFWYTLRVFQRLWLHDCTRSVGGGVRGMEVAQEPRRRWVGQVSLMRSIWIRLWWETGIASDAPLDVDSASAAADCVGEAGCIVNMAGHRDD